MNPRPVAGAGCAAAAAGARLAGLGLRVREGHRAAARPGAPRRPGVRRLPRGLPVDPGVRILRAHRRPGWNVRRISAAFALLMQRLGYPRYGAAGGGWGAIITTDLVPVGRGRRLCGLYLTMPLGEPPEGTDDPEAGLSDRERQGLRDWAAHQAAGTVIHLPLNTTRPHTMAFALNDSPAGLAAWLVDMYRSFSDCGGDVERRFTKDELLANVTTYWLTGTIASAARLYAEWAEQKRTFPRPPRVQIPTGCAVYPRDVRRVPRSWAERQYTITRWTQMPAGGHFPSLEEPGPFVADLAEFFRSYR